MATNREEYFIGRTPASERVNCDAVRFGSLLFLSGCGPLDENHEVVGGDDIREQTRQVLRNIEAVLAAAGASLSNVVRVTTYLTSVEEWKLIKDIRIEAFGSTRPASTLVGVSGLARPGMRIEMDLIAGFPAARRAPPGNQSR